MRGKAGLALIVLLATNDRSRGSDTGSCDSIVYDHICIVNSTRSLSETLMIDHKGGIVIAADVAAPEVFLSGTTLDLRSSMSCTGSGCQITLDFNSTVVLSGSASVTGANVSIRAAALALQETSYVSVSGLGSTAGAGAGASAGSGSDTSSGGGAGGGHGGDVRVRATRILPLPCWRRDLTC